MSSKKVALKTEIIRMDEDSAQGCFPNRAQVIRGEKWGMTQQGGGCGEKWGSFPENGKALREKAGCLMGKGRNGEEKQIGKGDGDAGGN